jgi:vanillate O-demethylase ferredoxin subunit
MSNITVRVASKQQEALGIASFELMRADGGPLPSFSAGSHVDVRLPGGLTRQYSLCNDDGERHRYRIAVLRDPHSRGGSTAMHDHVRAGDSLEISTPRNHFPLVRSRRTLLFAGGIGVTPILCMAQRLAGAGAGFQMHYCARSPEHTAFRDEMAAASYAHLVEFHYDNGPAYQKLDARAALSLPDGDTHVYVCGPKGFIDFITSTARDIGWPSNQVHVEHFGAALVNDVGNEADFRVQIASSGLVYDVPAEKTIVQALQAHGIEIPVSCEQGVCGTCVTRVLAGECDHRDLYFTDEEHLRNDQLTPCCSRAKSPILVLDL